MSIGICILCLQLKKNKNTMIFFDCTSCLSVVEKATTSSIGHSSKFPSSFNLPPFKVSLHMILDSNGVILKMKFNIQHGYVSQNQRFHLILSS